jgi:hypothetical protein
VNIPLSTFAFEYPEDGANFCTIYVEYLDPSAPQNSQVIVGAMFWQSFLGVFTTDPNVSTVKPSLSIYTQSNTYVLPGVYIGSASPSPTAVNPFAVVPVTPVVVPSSGNYLPTVYVKTTTSSYLPWTIDF